MQRTILFKKHEMKSANEKGEPEEHSVGEG